MNTTSTRPIVYGEVLFDRFPDGQSVLGGAPFNVAWHLHGFGLAPLMITAIGSDEAGQKILDRMQQWGMDISGVQHSEAYPTGQVKVNFDSGEPSYEITENQAYDHIDFKLASDAVTKVVSGDVTVPLLYHGSLIERTEQSRETLQQLLASLNNKSFVDINLRPPWWSMEQIKSALQAATWVKLNTDELLTVMNNQQSSDTAMTTIAQQLFSLYELELLIVTLGSKGAFLINEDGVVNAAPVKLDKIVDTVGAGDSFSAVMIMGLLLDWPMTLSLHRALQFAAAICQNQGATTMDRSLYTNFLQQWQN